MTSIVIKTNYANPLTGEDDVVVLVDGKPVKGFNSISDDYAYTNAHVYAESLKIKYEKEKQS